MHVVLIEFRTSDIAYVTQLANALSKVCRVTLMLPTVVNEQVNQVDQSKVNLKFFQMPRMRSLANLRMVFWLRRQIKEIAPDLVHITYWHIWGTPGLGLLFPIPIVATVHDVERHFGERGFWGVPHGIHHWQWRWAKQIIVHATNARQQLITQHGCSPEKVHVIPIGAYNFFTNFIRENQPESKNTLLFFGRIWGYKGLEYLIKAEPLISQVVPDVCIIIAGHGESFEKYRRSMINPDRFEVHNHFIPNNEVAGYFQRASIVVLPYVEASQSGVAAIAYAFGKPVVATNVGGLPDLVLDGETGLLVPPADAFSLAQAIIKLIKDPALCKKLGVNAREFGRTELSWAVIAEKTLKVYDQIWHN